MWGPNAVVNPKSKIENPKSLHRRGLKFVQILQVPLRFADGFAGGGLGVGSQRELVGQPLAGWMSFQPLYDWVVTEQPDLLD